MRYEEGVADGISQGIEAFILDNLEEKTEEEILGKLKKRFSLSAEQAKSYLTVLLRSNEADYGGE